VLLPKPEEYSGSVVAVPGPSIRDIGHSRPIPSPLALTASLRVLGGGGGTVDDNVAVVRAATTSIEPPLAETTRGLPIRSRNRKLKAKKPKNKRNRDRKHMAIVLKNKVRRTREYN